MKTNIANLHNIERTHTSALGPAIVVRVCICVSVGMDWHICGGPAVVANCPLCGCITRGSRALIWVGLHLRSL